MDAVGLKMLMDITKSFLIRSNYDLVFNWNIPHYYYSGDVKKKTLIVKCYEGLEAKKKKNLI